MEHLQGCDHHHSALDSLYFFDPKVGRSPSQLGSLLGSPCALRLFGPFAFLCSARLFICLLGQHARLSMCAVPGQGCKPRSELSLGLLHCCMLATQHSPARSMASTALLAGGSALRPDVCVVDYYSLRCELKLFRRPTAGGQVWDPAGAGRPHQAGGRRGRRQQRQQRREQLECKQVTPQLPLVAGPPCP